MEPLPLPPVHEGGSIYVNGFPSGPKPYEEVLTFLRKGTELLKFGRLGHPKYHPFRLSNDDLELQWESKKGQIRRIPLQCITKWQKGQGTAVFKKDKKYQALENLSFSIFYIDEAKKARTLDVVCRTMYDFEMWFWGVQIIRYYPPHAWSAPTPLAPPAPQQYSNAVVPAGKREAPAQPVSRAPPPLEIPAVRASLTDDRTPKTVPKSKPGLSVMAGSRSGLVHSVPPMRRDRRELGDLYVWGTLTTHEHDDWYEPKPGNVQRASPREELNPEAMRQWQNSREPVLVQNASSVDVVRVACAARHAALITRKGELYTWGYGKNGNLGHGWCADLTSPRLVTRMSGKGVHMVSCSEGATAAITADMRLFMWGSGSAGQLGNGYTFPCVEPAPVIFPGLPEDVRVLAVSCGPFHTAAVTEDGQLYTWGSGLFGKLGHGTHASEFRPRKVAALEDKSVTCVSCGYWHTAAVAVPRAAAMAKEQSIPFMFHTATTAPATTDWPPTAGAGGAGGPVAGAGRAGLSCDPRDASSSGSDLQGVIAAANAAGGTRASFTATDGAAPGAAGGASGTGGLLHQGRSEGLSSSVASMDQLREAAERSPVASDAAGALYTWGGDFSWIENSDPAKLKRDHNCGCLGLGDKDGRLVPTRVRGDLDKHGVVQVACGWSMTIALSRDGRVYQMGSTGATKSGEKGCSWEGATTPTRVDGNLFGMFVEEVTCGMHHVVVVASKVQANGHIAEDQRRVRLLTWGRGTEGQLGIDSKVDGASGEGPLSSRMPPQVDYLLPQVVSAVDGKRVLHVSAGGNHTMAVIEHDPRVRRAPASTTPAATPTNPYGNGVMATPSGAVNGNASSRATSHMTAPTIAGSVPTREGSAVPQGTASSLLGMASPFTIANALPITAAAAGLQTLQQMVGTVVPRSKLSTPAGSTSMRASRRHQGPSRQMVAIPQRSEILRSSDFRRSAAQRGGQTSSIAGSAGALAGHLGKSLSTHAKLHAEASVGSSGMLSHRSSPPMAKGQDEADSRSLSPSSSTLYEVGSSVGDLQSAREHGAAGAGAAAAASDDGHGHGHGQDVAGGPGPSRVHAHAYGSGAGPPSPGAEADGMAGLGDLSMTGLSTADMDAESDGYYRGRGLDMVPEQSEESPVSPVPAPSGRHSHHAAAGFTQYHNANGVVTTTTRGHAPYVDSPESVQEVLSLSAEGLPAEQHVPMHPRVALLARGSGGGSPGGGVHDAMRTSASTAETSYGTGSSGAGSPGPETPDDAVTSHSPRAGMPGGPYSMLHEPTPAQPQPLPYAAHLPQPPGVNVPPGVTLLPVPPSSTPLASPSAAPTGRCREVSIAAWAQPPAAPVPAPTAAAMGGPPAGLYRGEASFRLLDGGITPVAPPAHDAAPPRHGATAAAGGRGSRGHSRHASHDSIDLAPGRDSRPVFELVPSSVVVATHAGGSGAHTPQRLSANAMLPPVMSQSPAGASDAQTLVLKQQNELLMQQVEALRQQVTLLAQAAGLGAAAAAAGGAAAAAGAGASTAGHAFPPPMPHMQQSQPPTPSAAAALHGAVPLPHGALQPQQGPIAVPVVKTAGEMGGAGPSSAAAASAYAGSGGSTPNAGLAGSQLLPPPPLHLHHAMSLGHAATAAAPLASPSGHGMLPLGPMGAGGGAGGAGGPPRAATFDRQVHGGGGPHAEAAAAPTGSRHRRSTSIDVSSLIATRDGIGPAKDYLPPAQPPQPPLQATSSMSHLGGGSGSGSFGRDGSGVGHHTAPPALDGLRKAHPGMTLAQAAVAEADEEGLDEDEEAADDDDDNASAVEGEGDAGSEAGAEEALPPPAAHVQALSAPPQAAAGSMHRFSSDAAPQLAQQSSQGRVAPGYAPHPYELNKRVPPDAGAAPQPGSRDGSFAAPKADVSERSSCSSSDSVAPDGAAASAPGDEGGRRAPRAGMVDMQQMRLQQHHHHTSAGGAGRIGSGGGAPPAGSLEEQHGAAAANGIILQYVPGVWLTFKPPQHPGLRTEVSKVRFSRRRFSPVEAQQWLDKHRAELHEAFNVTAALPGGGGSSRNVSPSGYPASPSTGPPQPGLPQPPAATHTRGPSTDTQGSGGAGNSFYFSIPIPGVHGYGTQGSGGSAAGHPPVLPVDSSLTRASPAAWASPAAVATAGYVGDPSAHWSTVDPSVLAMPPPAPVAQPLAGMPPPVPRYHHSRSGSRNASGGASAAGATGAPAVWAAPRDMVPAMQPPAAGGGAGSHFRHHSRSRSGGAVSSQSNESNRSNRP